MDAGVIHIRDMTTKSSKIQEVGRPILVVESPVWPTQPKWRAWDVSFASALGVQALASSSGESYLRLSQKLEGRLLGLAPQRQYVRLVPPDLPKNLKITNTSVSNSPQCSYSYIVRSIHSPAHVTLLPPSVPHCLARYCCRDLRRVAFIVYTGRISVLPP